MQNSVHRVQWFHFWRACRVPLPTCVCSASIRSGACCNDKELSLVLSLSCRAAPPTCCWGGCWHHTAVHSSPLICLSERVSLCAGLLETTSARDYVCSPSASIKVNCVVNATTVQQFALVQNTSVTIHLYAHQWPNIIIILNLGWVLTRSSKWPEHQFFCEISVHFQLKKIILSFLYFMKWMSWLVCCRCSSSWGAWGVTSFPDLS